MAASTEVARLVAVIMAQNDQFMKKFAETEAELSKFKKNFEQASNTVERHTGSMMMSMRDMRHTMHLMAATQLIPHEGVQALMQGVYAFHLMEHAVEGLIPKLFTLKGAIIGTGIGALVVAVGMLWQYLAKLSEQAKQTEKAVSDAFTAWLDGAKSIEDIKADAEVSILKKDFEELHTTLESIDKVTSGINWTGYWQLLKGTFGGEGVGVFGALRAKIKGTDAIANEAIDDMFEKIEKADAKINRFASNAEERLGKIWIGIIEMRKKANDAAFNAEMEAHMVGMTEAEKKGYKLIAEGMQRTDLPEDVVRRMFGPQIQTIHEQMEIKNLKEAEAARQKSITSIYEQADAIQDEAERTTLGADESKRMAIIQKYARDQQVSLSEAIRVTSQAMREMKEAQDDLAEGMLEKKAREMGDEVTVLADKLLNGEDSSKRVAMALKYAEDHAVPFGEALALVTKYVGAFQDQMSILKYAETTMTPFEKFQIQMKEINRLFDNGKKYPELYARAVMQAEKALNGAANAGERFQATGFFSAEAQSRLEEFHDRMESPIPLGMRTPGGGISAFGAEGQGRTNQILGDMRDILRDRLRPSGIPLDIGSGHVPAAGGGITP